jgi:hypothetical protein
MQKFRIAVAGVLVAALVPLAALAGLIVMPFVWAWRWLRGKPFCTSITD